MGGGLYQRPNTSRQPRAPPSDAALYAEIAREEQVALVPDVFSAVLGDAALRADPVHPNAAGYLQMAQGLHQRLKALGIAP